MLTRYEKFKLTFLHAWQLPLKERLTAKLLPRYKKNGVSFFQGVVVAKNGCVVNVDTANYLEYKIFSEGSYELNITELIKLYLKKNSVFIDIGANIGIHSLSVAKSASAVYAFEPIDFIREKLVNNISLNRIENIIVVPFALSNENKVIKTNFSSSSSNQGTFSIVNEAEGISEIKCVIGDEYISNNAITNISVIKIDVEGFEHSVLQGLKSTILSHKPVIFFEYDTNYIGRDNKTATDYDTFFKSLDYNLFAIERSVLEPVYTFSHLQGMKEIVAIPFFK